MPWYQKGNEGEKAVKDFEEDRASRASGVFRLWIPAGGSTQFTFLDSTGFFFKEHNYYANGTWMNYETCIQDIGEEDCPFCESGVRTYYEAVFTVIDHAEYVSKKTQKTMTNTKKLLVLRSTARKKVLRKKDQQDGDLTYVRMSTNRDDAKECSTGEDFEVIKRVTVEEVMAMAPVEYMGQAIAPEAWIQPFDYPKLFQPKSAAALQRSLGRLPAVGSGDAPSRSADSPNVPKTDSPAPSVESLLKG